MASGTTTNKGWSKEDDDTEAFSQADMAATAFADIDASLFGVGATASRPGTPDEGDQYVNTTLDRQEWYDGAAWRQNIDNKQWTAKGILLTASAASTIVGLAVGSNNAVLVAASGESGGMLWSATLAGLTLTAPTIADFTNAAHDHGDADDGGAIVPGAIPANAIDAITEIAAALKSGADLTLITGTEGTSGDLAQWNADGDLVDGPTPPTGTIVGTTDTQTLSAKTLSAPTITGGAWLTGDMGGPPVNTANVAGVLVLAGGSNAGANDTLVGLDAFRSATRIGRFQWGLAGATVAGVATTNDDLIWVNSAGGYRVVFDDSTSGLIMVGQIRTEQNIVWYGGTAFPGTFVHAISTARTWTLPNASGTIALDTAASVTVAGIVELATAAETTTGTDATRAVTPDGLAGSEFGERAVQIVVFDFTTDVATGDGKFYFHIDSRLAGMDLVDAHAEVITAGTTGTTDIQIANVDAGVDMLSTKLTIDSGETGSDTAATPAVINAANDDVQLNEVLRIDVDAVSTTAPKGLILTLGFRLP